MAARASPQSPPYPGPPSVMWEECPIATTLGSLGRRWTLPILRDVAFFPKASFGLMLKRNRGLTPRTLSLRLQQLAREELVRKVVPEDDRRHPFYELTEKGLEVWPILAALFQFGIRNYPAVVFEDKTARNLEDVFPHDAELMLGYLAEFARNSVPSGPAGPGAPMPSASATPGRSRPGRR
ncbi:MAG: helix-turn-helix transcriptional regulator [Thermoplasmata archaeon]|nr:helix-turn-helix transcriptional regulator [Thermoplasmata archaeon]MCI4353866.1 helix-turn-helix transcriptional regulator [Thermoplasmata archaeon]